MNIDDKLYKEEFNCGKFKVMSYDRYDYEVNDVQKVYLLDDDDYVLAIVHDAINDVFYMIQQERFGINDDLIEFIGGGKQKDELSFDAIAREVEEETGIKAGIHYAKEHIKLVSTTYMNPSMSSSQAYLFYIQTKQSLNEEDDDRFEHLNVLKLSFDEVNKVINNGQSSTASELLWTRYLAIRDQIQTNNVIFCDIDGVLIRNDESNPEKLCDYHFDEKMICNLINVAKCTNSKIVIDSTWRKNLDCQTTEYFGKMYPNPLPAIRERLGNLFIGTTSNNKSISKIDSVRLWLEQHNFNRKYVIVDDDKKENFQKSEFKNNFILTDPVNGLQKSDCVNIQQILKNDKQ